MYNGIGLTTPRGTGTSGYVQANLSSLHFSKNRTDYNTEAEIAKAEAEINREPNAELLDHEFKRAIEIKCVEFEDLMEGKGFSEEEICSKVDEYRQLLYTDLESGRQEMLDKGELDLRNSHSRAKVAKDARDRFRMAVGIDAAFVDGSSMEKFRKAAEAAKMAPDSNADIRNKEEMDKSLMEKVMDRLKKAKETKKRKRDQSPSSSSSSDSDSSSTTSSSSSSSTDSDEERSRRRVKKSSTRRDGKRESPPKFKVPKQELESVRSDRPPAGSLESTRRGTSGRDELRSRGREGSGGDTRRRQESNEHTRNASPPQRQRRDERSKSRERRPDSDEEREQKRRKCR